MASREAIVARPVTVAATPPSFETVEIFRPDELSSMTSTEYLVTPTGEMPVLGVLRGTLSYGGAKSVLLTFSVPKRARAGRIEVARVRFTAAGTIPVDVPVVVEVQPAERIDLRILDGTPVVVQGERLRLRYTVANVGNRAENVTVTAIVPPGWRVQGEGGMTVPLGVNEMREHLLVMDVPVFGATRSASVRLIASLEDRPVASVDASVTVLAERRTTATGPRLVTGVTIAEDGSGTAYGFSGTIDGQLTPGIRIAGRFQGLTSEGSAGNFLFQRLGSFGHPSSLALDATAWSVAVGYTGVRLGGLTGSNVMGTGAVSTVRGDRWSATALAARPGSGRAGDQREGFLAGGRFEFNTGPVLLAATGTHMAERAFEHRWLEALGLGATVPALWDGELSAELAHRRFATGAGVGYAARFVRRTPIDNISMEVTHAPGGRAGFAQATDQVNLHASRTLTRHVGVHAGYWHSRDGATASFSRLGSTGWSGAASLRVTNGLSMGLGGRHSSFEAVGIAGTFASADQALEANLNLQSRVFFARGRATVGSAWRETSVAADSVNAVEAGDRLTLDGSIGARSAAGLFTLNGRYDRSGVAAGAIPVRAEISARAEGVPLLTRGEFRIRAMAEVRQSFWPGFGPTHTAAITGLTAHLPLGLAVELAAERNPFFVRADGTPGWIYGVRIERSTELPALIRKETRGLVYHDLNQNGRRDTGEPGYAGAMIRRRGEITVSRENGTYRFPGTGGRGVLDPLSLGHGWITGAVDLVDGRQEIAVISVAPLKVLLSIEDAQGLGTSADALAPAAVIARDEAGRVWVARRHGSAEAFFDALPPGRYSLEVDLTDVSEPLSMVGALPSFTVRPGDRLEPVTVRLKPRSIQIRQLGPARQ